MGAADVGQAAFGQKSWFDGESHTPVVSRRIDAETEIDQERLADSRNAEALADVAFLAKVERRAEGGDPFRTHPISIRKRDHPAVDRAFDLPIAHVEAAARRTAEKSAHAKHSVGLDRRSRKFRRKPASAGRPHASGNRNPKSRHLAEIVAVGIGKQADVGVQRDPIDDMLIAGRAAFGLPTLPSAQSHDRQIVDHFGARRGYPTAHAGAHGIKTLVELRGEAAPPKL